MLCLQYDCIFSFLSYCFIYTIILFDRKCHNLPLRNQTSKPCLISQSQLSQSAKWAKPSRSGVRQNADLLGNFVGSQSNGRLWTSRKLPSECTSWFHFGKVHWGARTAVWRTSPQIWGPGKWCSGLCLFFMFADHRKLNDKRRQNS